MKGRKLTACLMAAGMALHLLPRPAFTLEMVPICGQQEHIHGDTCFVAEERLSCGEETMETHIHGEGCFQTETVLSCTLSEHTHGEECYAVPETTETAAQPPETTEAATAATTEATEETTIPTEETTIPTEETTVPTEETTPTTEALEAEQITVSMEPAMAAAYGPEEREDDRTAVSGDGISFRLFDYSLNINKDASGSVWRSNADFFTFRDSKLSQGDAPSNDIHVPTDPINPAHDADGFPAAHATVERILQDGMPVLDLSRNADGTARNDPGLSRRTRSLSYLFGGAADPAVTAYIPDNTILQKDGNHYWYDSSANAVDYDAASNRFRVRGYTERNATTAGYGEAYGDFLPFNHTGGVSVAPADAVTPYHLTTEDVNYWFGMTMQVDFYQSKDGTLGDGNMIFRFSGDDDVWVFVDDVLVLDLGGTHGTVDGSINFATGEILQYLSWQGANATEAERRLGSATSFPTTLRACFDAAGCEPNGGWSENGETFADYTEHTLTFFYLERGAAVANCKIDFRLPTLPDKSLTVTKELTAAEPVADFLKDTLSYRFRVLKDDGSGDLFLTPGMAYTLLEQGSAVGAGQVDDGGYFSLKAGQSAQFTEMLAKGGGSIAYTVQELLPNDLTGQYAGVEYTVSGGGGTAQPEEGPAEEFTAFATDTLSAEQTQVVTFRNRVDVSRLCTLKITKQMAQGTAFTGEERFFIRVTLGGQPLPVGTEYTVCGVEQTVAHAGILLLGPGQTAVLGDGILSGTAYTVEEQGASHGAWRPAYSAEILPSGEARCTDAGVTGEFALGTQVHITVTNGDYRLPSTGGSGADLYTLGGLLQSAAAVGLLYYQRKRDRKG